MITADTSSRDVFGSLTSDRQSSAATDDVEDEFALMEKQRAAKRARLEALRMRDDGQAAS